MTRASSYTLPAGERWVAIDGEAVDGRYVLMVATTRTGGAWETTTLRNLEGIRTEDALVFLSELRAAYPHRRLVMFGSGYDTNMLLGDVPAELIRRLWSEGHSWVTLPSGDSWRLEWAPSRWFGAKHEFAASGVRVTDVYPLFRSSFVRALEAWGIDAPAIIGELKLERDAFTTARLGEVAAYCLAETRALVELMCKVEASVERFGWRPRRWSGAGSFATCVLEAEGVAAHLQPEEQHPPALRSAIMRAYYGGRVETYGVGDAGACRGYDLRAAYPWALSELPSMLGAEWRRRRTWTSDAPEHSLWRCSWRLEDAPIAPFPVRHNRSVYWHRDGSGWYWQPEVAAARAAYGDAITVHQGYQLEPVTPAQPFRFLRDLYATRRELADRGDPAELIVKLAMTAIVGKLAQGLSSYGKAPRYQCFALAGLATSKVRARMFRVMHENAGRVVSVATDGVLLSGAEAAAGELELGPEPGQWETDVFRRVFVAQPGVYRAELEDGELIGHTQGWFPREIDWTELEAGFAETGAMGRYTSVGRRFIGAGACIRADLWADWRQWRDVERAMDFYPFPRMRLAAAATRTSGDDYVWEGFEPMLAGGLVADPYIPPGVDPVADADQADDDWIAGREQPLTDYDVLEAPEPACSIPPTGELEGGAPCS